MPISKLFARLAVDANPLLSALIGGAAYRVLLSPRIGEFVAPFAVVEEVREYLPVLARKYRLDRHLLELTLAVLPVHMYNRESYAEYLSEAGRRMERRDPRDVDLLALALKFQAPVWSNDRDFASAEVEWWTTARLLARLGHP